MISYNPREWFTFIVRFHKADTLRQLMPLTLGICAYTLIVAVVDINVLFLDKESTVSKIVVMHSILGFVISLLLVFRTNTAYERWWEGRKLWGALVNCTRNMAIKLKVFAPAEENDWFRKHLVSFPFALKNHLRNAASLNEVELMELYEEHKIKEVKHVPIMLSLQMYQRVAYLHKKEKINGEQLLILNNELQQWMEICGACERIRNTPIPFSYSVFLKKFIFFYIMTLPLAYAPVLGYYAIPIVAFIFYVLASLELIAEEIENPFGTDANDLPLDEISKNIKNNVESILGH